MTVIDKINVINEVIKEVFEFIQRNQMIRADFNEYISTLGAKRIPLNQMEKVFLPYIFERRIGGRSILAMFLDSGTKHRDVAESLLRAHASIFEIKRILKNGFELYNLINEKTYTALSLTKMTNFRGVYAGQYIVARLFEYENDYYVIEIANVLSHSQKDDAMRFAVMKLIQNPKELYVNNPEKEDEIKDTIAGMYKKFTETFDKDVILTTSKYADEIIGSFNDGEQVDMEGKGSEEIKHKFFHVKELDNNYSNFLENSLGGFASHSELYDVAVIFDKERGLFTIPFYETFSKIFEDKASIEGADDCIRYFLSNDSIPDSILKMVADKHSNFMSVVNESLKSNYTFDQLLKKYKSGHLKNRLYSSATVLYCSKVFSEVFDVISTPKREKLQVEGKVGRNEPCPCGSGKKYKNCCGKD